MPLLVEEVTTAAGHRFNLRRSAPDPGVRTRPGLLWLPALGVPAQKYDSLATALARRGIPVAIHEWRGLASSSLRASRHCDWGYRELLHDDLPATLQRLADDRDWLFGGHSLGAQLAAMLAARHPDRCAGLALVAAGVPFPATFPPGRGLGLAALARLMPLLVAAVGHFPGHRLGFAGREAARLMRDWAATARRGRYADYGDGTAMEELLGRVDVPVLGVTMAHDWMAPSASLAMLLAKLGGTRRSLEVLDAAALGTAADHFRWMRRPDAVAAAIDGMFPVSS